MARKKKNTVTIQVDENGPEVISEPKEKPEKQIIVLKKVRRKKPEPLPVETQKEQKPNNNIMKIVLFVVIALLLILGFLFGILPLLKENKARSLYEKGQYEEAINVLKDMQGRDNSAKIISDSEYAIAKRSAEYLLDTDSDLKTRGLTLESIEDPRCALDYKNKSEISSFIANYKNGNYTYKTNYSVSNSRLNDGSWNMMEYKLVDSQIIPVLQSDQKIADAAVLKDYPAAVFKNTNVVNEAETEYVYELISTERPLYKTGYLLTADCAYDPLSNIWKVSEIRKDLIDSEPIPFKTFKTSIFTISAPETWTMTRNENIYTWTNNSSIHFNYDYTYNFYPDQTNSSVAMTLYVYFSADNTNNYYNGANSITARNIGKGTYTQYDKSVNVNFWPVIRKMNANFNLYANNITIEELQSILDSIVIKDSNYKLTVIKGPINIRNDSSSRTGTVLGKAAEGNTFTASRAVMNEGYTWFEIGEGRWIADNNGEWIRVE